MSDSPLPRPLLARYRRPLTFGGLLDQTIQVWRQIWLPCAVVMGMANLPFLALAASRFGATGSGQAPTLGLVGPILLAVVGSLLATVLAGGAVVGLSDWAMRGERLGVRASLATGLGRLPAMIGASLLYGIASSLVTLLAIPLLLLTLVAFFGLLPLIVAIMWFTSPATRTPWRKWMIVLGTPFGLPVYVDVRWALWPATVVLERCGPGAALERSGDLVRGNWFRCAGVLALVWLITTVLQMVVGSLVSIVGVGVIRVLPADLGGAQLLVVVQPALNLVGTALFSGLTYIALAVLYHDLRNRNEGGDLDERLGQMEDQDPVLASEGAI